MKGQDGTSDCDLHIQVRRQRLDVLRGTPRNAQVSYGHQRETTKAARIADIEGPWDEAAFLAGDTSSVEGLVVFRKTTKVVSASYDGTDKSYGLEDGRCRSTKPIDEAEHGAKAVPLEIAQRSCESRSGEVAAAVLVVDVTAAEVDGQ